MRHIIMLLDVVKNAFGISNELKGLAGPILGNMLWIVCALLLLLLQPLQ